MCHLGLLDAPNLWEHPIVGDILRLASHSRGLIPVVRLALPVVQKNVWEADSVWWCICILSTVWPDVTLE